MRVEMPDANSSKGTKSSANNSKDLASRPTLFSNNLAPPILFSQSSIFRLRLLSFRLPSDSSQVSHRLRECDGGNVAITHQPRIVGVTRFVIDVTADLHAFVPYEERLAQLDVRVHVDADVHALSFNEYIHARRGELLQIKTDTSGVAD